MYVCLDIYEHEGGGEGGTIILYIIFSNDSFIFDDRLIKIEAALVIRVVILIRYFD